MKNDKVLRYPLADIGPESLVMTVYLHRTPSGYWRFGVRYNHQIDVADRLFDSLADSAGEMLPEEFREDFSAAFIPEKDDEELWKLVKAADKISALIKCIEEKKAGNSEFIKAAEGIRESIENIDLPETKVFIEEFLPAYEMTLDELR